MAESGRGCVDYRCGCVKYEEDPDVGESCTCGHVLDCHDFTDRFGLDPRECICDGIVERPA